MNAFPPSPDCAAHVHLLLEADRAAAEAAGAEPIRIRTFDTMLGTLVLGATETGVCFLEFDDPVRIEGQLAALRRAFRQPLVEGDHPVLWELRQELDAYFLGRLSRFTVPLEHPGTDFQECMWRALQEIPCGETWSYERMATHIGHPAAVRAVGAANGRNRLAILVPCHRLVGSNGKLTGYGGGLERKRWLIEHEKRIGGASPEVGSTAAPVASPDAASGARYGAGAQAASPARLTDPERNARGTDPRSAAAPAAAAPG